MTIYRVIGALLCVSAVLVPAFVLNPNKMSTIWVSFGLVFVSAVVGILVPAIIRRRREPIITSLFS